MKDFEKIIGRNALTLIYFFTSRCKSCEEMEPVMREFERRMRGRTDLYRINTDSAEDTPLIERYAIRTAPTLLFFRHNDIIWRHDGPLSYEELLSAIEEVERREHLLEH